MQYYYFTNSLERPIILTLFLFLILACKRSDQTDSPNSCHFCDPSNSNKWTSIKNIYVYWTAQHNSCVCRTPIKLVHSFAITHRYSVVMVFITDVAATRVRVVGRGRRKRLHHNRNQLILIWRWHVFFNAVSTELIHSMHIAYTNTTMKFTKNMISRLQPNRKRQIAIVLKIDYEHFFSISQIACD